jgi:hypothetical protein
MGLVTNLKLVVKSRKTNEEDPVGHYLAHEDMTIYPAIVRLLLYLLRFCLVFCNALLGLSALVATRPQKVWKPCGIQKRR